MYISGCLTKSLKFNSLLLDTLLVNYWFKFKQVLVVDNQKHELTDYKLYFSYL